MLWGRRKDSRGEAREKVGGLGGLHRGGLGCQWREPGDPGEEFSRQREEQGHLLQRGSMSGVLEEAWQQQREQSLGRIWTQGCRGTGQDTGPGSLSRPAACLLSEVGAMEGSVQGGHGQTWTFTGFPWLEWTVDWRG